MIEILFGDSEAGFMKAAKCKKAAGKRDNGPATTIGGGRKESVKEKGVKWIPGSSGEVICLGFMLDIGDIKAATEEFSYFLQYEKELSKTERRMYEILWAELKEENAPLRAVVNGKLIGVEEDFYDFLIWRRLTDKPVKEARLIGDILGYYPLSVGDWWYARRIEHFISQGQVKVVEDSKREYARVICRA